MKIGKGKVRSALFALGVASGEGGYGNGTRDQ
jgi:hypothetical protein